MQTQLDSSAATHNPSPRTFKGVEKHEVVLGKWAIERCINGQDVNDVASSTGDFGVVYFGKGVNLQQKDAAIKIIPKHKLNPFDYDREINVMKCINTNNTTHQKLALCEYQDSIDNVEEGRYEIAMEPLMGGDFSSYFEKGVNEMVLRDLTRPIFVALAFLHEHKIVHTDINGHNLSFRDVAQTELVLIDFGLAYKLDWVYSDSHNRGFKYDTWAEKEFVSPEAVKPDANEPREQRLPYRTGVGVNMTHSTEVVLTPAIDVYMLGCLLLKAATRTQQLPDQLNQQADSNSAASPDLSLPVPPESAFQKLFISKTVVNNEKTAPPPPPVSDAFQDLIVRMTDANPASRITMRQALHHDWFALQPKHFPAHCPIPPPPPRFQDDSVSKKAKLRLKVENEKVKSLECLAMVLKTIKAERVEFDTKPVTNLGVDGIEAATAVIVAAKSHHGEGNIISLNSFQFTNAMKTAGLGWLSNLFRACDLDNNLSVDYREITTLLQLSGLFTPRQILRHFCFAVLDLNGDNKVDKFELTAALSNLVFETFDEKTGKPSFRPWYLHMLQYDSST